MDVSKINSSDHRKALMATAGLTRDFDTVSQMLASWLEGKLGENVAIADMRLPTGAGIANETLLFQTSYDNGSGRKTRDLVARLKPPKNAELFPDPDYRGLFDLLHTLRQHDLVKVPETLWFEDDESVLGTTFFIMEKIDGRTPVTRPPYLSEGWLADGTPAQRNTAWTTAIEALASIHRAPGELVSFIGMPQYGETGEDQQIGYWNHYAEWSGVKMPPKVVELGKWCEANRPHIPGVYLSWGDARIGNMMFGDDFRVAAVLDWDQMALCDPKHDLAWWLFFEEFNSTGQDIPIPKGMGNREQTIALWEEHSGLKAGDLGWHEAYMAYKVALITMKTLIDGKQDYDDSCALAERFAIQGFTRGGA